MKIQDCPKRCAIIVYIHFSIRCQKYFQNELFIEFCVIERKITKGWLKEMEEFKSVSVRGRVAYAIRCLEETLLHYEYPLDQWEWVLEKLWTYTDIDYWDDWFYEIAEYVPESILECNTYKSHFEYVSEEQFMLLYALYQKTNEATKKIIEIIFEMGTRELYGKVEHNSQLTLDFLLELRKLMKDHNIPMPSFEGYPRYSFNVNGGYGDDFDGKELSVILK